jgi:MATE family multidrug resistance protein
MTRWHEYRAEVRALGRIAWPIVIAQLAQMGTGVVDTIMAGRYSAIDLAAIAIGYNIWLPLFLLTLGVMLATSVTVAQDFGAGKLDQVRNSLPQALWLAVALGAVVGPLCFNVGPLVALLDLDPVTRDKSLGYLQAVAFGLPATVIFQALRCHTQGLGIMRPFAVASVLGFLANVPLNYMLIYGKWGAPELGATGCGWATAISMWLSPALIGLYMAISRSIRPYLPPLRPVAPDLRMQLDILRLGLPIGFTFFLEISVFTVISLMIATLGTSAMAAHQIAWNIWDVTYMPMISVGSAMATRVGHAIGSGDHHRIDLSVRAGVSLTILIGLLSASLLLLVPGALITIYTSDPEIHVIAGSLIRLAALFILLDSLQVASAYVLRAFRETRYPFVVLCLSYWLLSLPLAWWLGMVRADGPGAATAGVWQALIVGLFVSTLFIGLRLYRRLQGIRREGARGTSP